jgi:integrase
MNSTGWKIKPDENGRGYSHAGRALYRSSELCQFFYRNALLHESGMTTACPKRMNLRDLSLQERDRILDRVGGADRILLLLLFESGLEAEDLLNLRATDLDLEKGELLLHGGKRIHLSPLLQSELAAYFRSRPSLTYLLEGRCGMPMTVKWKRCVLEKLLHQR